MNLQRYGLESVVREKFGDRLDEIGVYALAGDGNAVKIHSSHSLNPSISFRSICFIDGDSRQIENDEKGIFRLPGTMPELTVFNSVLSNIDNNIALLTVACQRSLDKQDLVAKAIRSISYTNRDPHNLFNQVGLKIGFVSEAIVRGAFLAIWIQENPDQTLIIMKHIEKALESPS